MTVARIAPKDARSATLVAVASDRDLCDAMSADALWDIFKKLPADAFPGQLPTGVHRENVREALERWRVAAEK
jgi:hypothetical protein